MDYLIEFKSMNIFLEEIIFSKTDDLNTYGLTPIDVKEFRYITYLKIFYHTSDLKTHEQTFKGVKYQECINCQRDFLILLAKRFMNNLYISQRILLDHLSEEIFFIFVP